MVGAHGVAAGRALQELHASRTAAHAVVAAARGGVEWSGVCGRCVGDVSQVGGPHGTKNARTGEQAGQQQAAGSWITT